MKRYKQQLKYGHLKEAKSSKDLPNLKRANKTDIMTMFAAVCAMTGNKRKK